jgi:cytochrome c-type biogenesis protein CcmH/NrfG
MLMRRILGFARAALCGACLCLSASAAQTPRTGAVSGVVSDPNEALVHLAEVVFESPKGKHETVTDDEGRFAAELAPGLYDLSVWRQGFCRFRLPSVRVRPGGAESVNVRLKVAAIVNVMHTKDGRYVGEEDISVEADTGQPCSPSAARATPAEVTPAAFTAPQRRGRAARPAATATSASRSVTVKTQPGAVVWVDEVRRGVTDAEGQLKLTLTSGRHALRVRAKGFAEHTQALLPTQRGDLNLTLKATTDEAELLFQQAEEAREKGGGAEKAAELYRQALKLRPRFAAAHIGLARALLARDDHDGALEQVEEARRDRPGYAEASVVEGRALRDLADHEAALEAFARALRESRGFNPEAHTGIGLAHEEKGRHEEAVAAFRKAIAQLSDTEPVLYELLGRNLEKLERWKEAADAYDKYLQLAPEGSHASAIRSIIDQLRQQAAEQEQQTP